MKEKGEVAVRTSFEKEFLLFVSERIAAAGRAMPGGSVEEYESLSAQHSRLFGEISGRLGEGGRDLLLEFDFVTGALASFDVDNAYMQGFADGIAFMGLHRNIVIK